MTETTQVSCDAGRGVVTKEQCLTCALAQQNACGYDYSLLVYLLNDGERTGIHVTDLTGCLRMAYYRRTVNTLAEYPHDMLIRKLGTAVHAQLESGDPYFGSEVSVNALGIVGKMDVFYNSGRILDYKTTRWMTPSKLPYGSHEKQVNYYAALMREMGNEVSSAAIQYIDLSGPTKCKSCGKAFVPRNGDLACPSCGKTYAEAHLGAKIFEVSLMPHGEVVAEITERRDALLLSLEAEIAPAPEDSFLCNYCPFVHICTNK